MVTLRFILTHEQIQHPQVGLFNSHVYSFTLLLLLLSSSLSLVSHVSYFYLCFQVVQAYVMGSASTCSSAVGYCYYAYAHRTFSVSSLIGFSPLTPRTCRLCVPHRRLSAESVESNVFRLRAGGLRWRLNEEVFLNVLLGIYSPCLPFSSPFWDP